MATKAPPKSARPADGDGLEARIVAALDRLTRKQQELARVMLEDELAVAFSSADDLGRRAGVDAATVVRFSRLLGYEGYADLRESVRRSVPQFLTALEKVSRSLARADQAGDLVAEVYSQDLRNIEETARLNPPRTVASAVSLLGAAERVYVAGVGMEGHVADHLALQLTLVGIPAQRLPRAAVDAAVELASAGPGDALIAVSVWRYVRDTVRLAEATREHGVPIVGLTDSRLSPLAGIADVLLVGATETAELSHSLTALTTLTNVLATALALETPERAIGRLRRIDELYERFEVLR